jgi:protein TonB
METVLTANAAFRKRYSKYLRNAFIAAIVLHMLLFCLSPPFHFKPYQLPPAPVMKVVSVDEFDPLPPPKEIDLPPASVEPAFDPQEGVETILPTLFDHIDDLPIQAVSGGKTSDPFIVVDQLPSLFRCEVPNYPQLALEAGLEGTVYVKVLVGEDGRVLSAEVIRSDVLPAMEKAALEAAKKCRFKPARQRTTPVRASVVIPFHFRLDR